VALGAALKFIDTVSFEEVNNYLGNIFKGSVKESNEKALKAGYDFI
jgi:Pyruvate/2-oxoacid:ferredoxin oxidoreductase gamma subunit